MALALDRQERGQGTQSAVQEVSAQFGLRCVSILTLTDLIESLAAGTGDAVRISSEQYAALIAYQRAGGFTPYPAGLSLGQNRSYAQSHPLPGDGALRARSGERRIGADFQVEKAVDQGEFGSQQKPTYKWVDEQGVTHYGDSVPAEYSQREKRVLKQHGVELQKQQAEMTPAESAAYATKLREESRRKQHDMFLIPPTRRPRKSRMSVTRVSDR